MKKALLSFLILSLLASSSFAIGPVHIGGRYGRVTFMYSFEQTEDYFKHKGSGYSFFLSYQPPGYPLSIKGEYASKYWKNEDTPADSSIDYTLGLYALYVLQPKPSPVGAFLGAGVARHQIKWGPLILPTDKTELKGKLGIDFKGGIQVTYGPVGIFFEGEYNIVFQVKQEPVHSQLGFYIGGFI
ncbi:MAG: hypothetical protein E3J87_09270 [Candidatus Cloacimonadota bacterium]|nr:MAG: hypothetical protein E3J87_09270 [Candidatus Cloacimonadota bacterium]